MNLCAVPFPGLHTEQHLCLQASDEDDVMFWDYGNPAGSGAAQKPNGSAAVPAQRVNGVAGGPAGSGAGKDKQGSSASHQQSKPAKDEPFSGTPMSPEFEVRHISPCSAV